MLMLLTIVVIAVAVLFFTAIEKGRCISLAIGLLCLALGGCAIALLSDVCSEGLVVSRIAAQEVEDSAASVERSEEVGEVETGQASVDHGTEAVAEPERKAVSELETASETRVEEPNAADPTDDLVLGTVTDVEFLTDRPAWVESKATVDGDVHVLPIESGLYSSKRETDDALKEQIRRAIGEYIDDCVGQSYASSLIDFEIRQVAASGDQEFRLVVAGQGFKIADKTFSEQVRVSVGVMHQSHVLVTLDQSVRDQIDHRWSEITAMYRLAQAGLGAGVVLLLLGTMFGYFKLDTATRGYYTGRLQFAAAAAIMTLIAASVFLGKWIPWL